MRRLPMWLGIVLCVGLVGVAKAEEDLDALNARVGELYGKGDYAGAVNAAHHAVKVAERQFGENAAETATPINNLAAIYDKQGQYVKAEPLYKRALAIWEKSHGADHPATAIALNNLARLYEAQGQYAQAEPLYKQALANCEKHLGPDDPDTVWSLGCLAGLYGAQGEYAQAEPLYQRALAVREKSLGPDHLDTATSLCSLAELYRVQGQYVRSEPLHQRALAIREKALGPDHPDTAQSLNNLAALYHNEGQYAQAEPLYRRALAINQKRLGPDHPRVAATLHNLAGLYESHGQHAQAEPLYQQALAIHEKSLGPDHPHTAMSLGKLAGLHESHGRYAQAELLSKQVIAIHEKSLGPDHPHTATSVNGLAGLYEIQGQYAKAEPLYQRALAIRTASLGANHPLTAESFDKVAVLYHVQGRYAQAEPLYQRALAIREASLGAEHPLTYQSVDCYAGLEAALGRFPAAARLFDRARRGMRRHAASVLPSLSAAEQADFLRTQDEGAFHAALTLGLLQKATPQIAALSAGWLANGKAVAQEAASQQIILARQSENPVTKAAVAAIELVRTNLAKFSQMTPEPTRAEAYRATIASLQDEEQKLVHEIGGQLAAIDRDEPWVEIDAIRKNIPAGGVLVDIARFRIFDFEAKGQDSKWQPARYAAWIVPPAGKGDVTILDLGAADEIDAAVAAYREAIKAVQQGGFKRGQDTAERELKITAAPLASQVLEPIVEAVGDATDIALSPDGALWLVPWQALPLADGSYAIEKYSIRTVTSARDVMPSTVDAKGGKGGSVVVADPAFDSRPAAPSGKAAADASRSFAPASGIERRFSRLPNTRTEAVASKPVLATLTGSEPKVLLGMEASETNLKQAAVRPKTVVLATHGFFKPDQEVKRDDKAATLASARPGSRGATRAVTTTGEALEDPLLRCGLALAGANVGAKAAGGEDGILTGAEIVGLDLLGTDLVVLSACETGVGKVQNGEGVAGLRQAFQIAGAQSVVATLWQVPDAESAQIMQSFYGNLAQGRSPSQALREAQLAFIKARREDRAAGEAAHPWLWAAYGVTGR